MIMYNKRYYIMRENNGKLECIESYEKIEDAKQHTKKIVDVENKDCLILQPVVRIKPDMGYIIRDIVGE